MKKLDLLLIFGYDSSINGEQSPFKSKSERLPTMKAAIRMFALFVAVAGLASASLAPANTQIRATRNSVADGDPVPVPLLPAPLPCQSINACYSPASSTR
jgi:hypothetical protein